MDEEGGRHSLVYRPVARKHRPGYAGMETGNVSLYSLPPAPTPAGTTETVFGPIASGANPAPCARELRLVRQDEPLGFGPLLHFLMVPGAVGHTLRRGQIAQVGPVRGHLVWGHQLPTIGGLRGSRIGAHSGMKAVLHRSRTLPDADQTRISGKIRFADWTLDTNARHLLSPQGVVVPLSGGEFSLLSVFLSHPDHVLSRDQLLELARGREAGPFERSIDVQVGRLRRRLGDDGKEPRIIKTVRNAGYVLAVAVENDR